MADVRSVSSLQKEYMAEHYRKASRAKEEGRPVVYVTAMFPVEIVKAFEPDVAVVYPENHAVNIIVNGLAEQFAEIAVSRTSLDPMGCSYELANTGYLLETKRSGGLTLPESAKSLPVLPEPDILLACNNQCDIVAEWFQHLSTMCGGVPFRVINVGNRYDGRTESIRIEYVRKQLTDVIGLLEERTAKKLDRDKLIETARRSNHAVKLWRKYLDLGKLTPSPMTAFDGFFHMALIVSERGTDQAIDYYDKLVKETSGIAGIGSVPGREKHRVLWDNLATWFNFGRLKRVLGERGVAVVGSTYLDVWKKELDASNYDNLLTSMAEAYCTMYTNLTIAQRIEVWKQMVRDYQAEGVLFHNNKSCHTFSRLQGQVAGALREEFGDGFKTIIFDGDMGLAERFQTHRFMTAIETFF